MSKLLGLVTAAALLSGVTAFAQTSTATNPAADAPSASAPAMSNPSAPGPSGDTMKKPHHHHHMMKSGENSASTDEDANKLNACMVDAKPTPSQENCLKHAENS
jgi:curli biogenesis system outer membrane secretion channel CsgG